MKLRDGIGAYYLRMNFDNDQIDDGTDYVSLVAHKLDLCTLDIAHESTSIEAGSLRK